MNINQILPCEKFSVKLSEVEVKLTLREMCGSKWYDYPFEGEVYEHSFSLTENYSGFRRNVSGVVLEGTFYEENGRTFITIIPNIKTSDLFAYLIFAVAGGTVLGYGIVEMFRSLLLSGGDGFFLGFLSAGAGAAISGIIYSMFFGSFQRSVERIKEALRAALRRSE